MTPERARLVEQNLRLVHSLCHRYERRGIEYDELFSAGCEGLCRAARGFDEQRGFAFSTYAVPVILGELRRLFRDGGSVRVSRSLKQTALTLSRTAARLRDALGREPTIGELATASGISPEQAAAALNATAEPLSLEGEPTSLSAPDETATLCERLGLLQLLKTLPECDEQLLRLRYFAGKTQQQTAAALGITQVQVSRRERRALAVLRQTAAASNY